MLSAGDAPQIARELDLGNGAAMIGPVARGVIGQVWRLDTDHGAWAIKEWFEQPDLDELTEGVAFQEAAMATGVPTPPVVRRPNGAWGIDLRGELVRAQGWVDLLDASPTLDAGAVGQLVAILHLVPFDGAEPVHEWYTDPVGAERWDALASAALVAGAPFAEQLAARRDDLV